MSKKLKLSIGNHTDKGMVRKVNQDSFGSAKSGWGKLYVVADGMGGHKGGETASKMAVDYICNKFKKEKIDNPLNFLNDAIIEANSIVIKKAKEEKELEGMGSTVVAVIISNSNAHIAHVGDSRCYIFRQQTPYQLTKDHSVVQRMVDEGVISIDEMETHPRKNEILQAVGIGDVKPSLRSESLFKNDILLLCSDGLSGEVSAKEMWSEVKKGDLMSASKNLVAMANERGGPDNSTVILIKVDSGSKPSKDAIPAPIMQPKPMEQTTETKSKPSPKFQLVAMGLVAVIVIALASYKFFNSKKPVVDPAPTPETVLPEEPEEKAKPEPAEEKVETEKVTEEKTEETETEKQEKAEEKTADEAAEKVLESQDSADEKKEAELDATIDKKEKAEADTTK